MSDAVTLTAVVDYQLSVSLSIVVQSFQKHVDELSLLDVTTLTDLPLRICVIFHPPRIQFATSRTWRYNAS